MNTKVISKLLVILLLASLLQNFQYVNKAFAENDNLLDDIVEYDENNVEEIVGEFEFDDVIEHYGNEITDRDELLEYGLIFDTEELTVEDLDQAINDELNTELNDEIEIEVTEFNESTVSVETTFDSSDISADFEVNLDAENLNEVSLSGESIENGELINHDYTVEVISVKDNEIAATFIDNITGEKFDYNSAELSPQFLPVIVVFIGGQVIRTVVTRVAVGKGFQYTVKWGKEVYKSVGNKPSKVATESYKTLNVKAGTKTISVGKGKMQHILQRHHPRYWNGTVTQNINMMNPSITVNNLKGVINTGLKSTKNNNIIKNNIKNGKSSTVYVKYQKTNFKILIDKNGNFQTFHPVK